MIKDLINRDGRHVHEMIHHVFMQFLDLLYKHLERPLHCYLLIITLRQELSWQIRVN